MRMSLTKFIKRLVSQLGRFQRPTEEPAPETEDERNWKRFREQAGNLRCSVLSCLLFKMPDDVDMTTISDFKPFIHEYLERLYDKWKHAPQDKPDIGIANIAAGLLTFGRLDMADVILENLPFDEYYTDHGAGKCFLIPMNIMAIYLRIPRSICPTSPSGGRMDRQAVIAWLAERRSRLVWSADAERFVLLTSDD